MSAAHVDDPAVKVPVQRQEGDLASRENRIGHEAHFFEANRAARLHARDDEAHLVHMAFQDEMRGRLVRFVTGDEVPDRVAAQFTRAAFHHFRDSVSHGALMTRRAGQGTQRLHSFK